MKRFNFPRRINLPALFILLVFILMPYKTEALRPLDEQDLIQNSPELVKNSSPSLSPDLSPDLSNDEADKSDSRLTPINDGQLDALSPAVKAPEPEVKEKPARNIPPMDQAYRDSVCFKRCHNISDFQPADHTARQWRLLIEKDGHSLFDEIPWQSQAEKEQVLNYLLEKSKNTSPAPAGIGVW